MKRNFFAGMAVSLMLIIGLFLWRIQGTLIDCSVQSQPRATGQTIPLQGQAVTEAVQTEVKRSLTKEESVAFEMQRAIHPISFHGKVVDQNNVPVPNAQIQLRCRQYFWAAPGVPVEKNLRQELFTDANGIFRLAGIEANGLTLEGIGKLGYQFFPKGTFTSQGNNDPDAPVIFKMWKRHGADRLVRQDKNFRIPYDGSPVSFDLMEGKEVAAASADVRIVLLRNPLERKWDSREKYDWTATIEILDGGIVESDDEFPFEAPKDGYVATAQIRVQATDSDWTPDKQISFYLKSRGKYGRVTLNFRTGSSKPKTGFGFQSSINPTGSRNLEYDYRQSTSTENHFPPEGN